MKKRSLSLVLAFAMILTMACGAWAATTATVSAGTGQQILSPDYGPLEILTGAEGYANSRGLHAFEGGTIEIGADLENNNAAIYSALSEASAASAASSDIKLTGSITMTGGDEFFAFAAIRSKGTMIGPIDILDGFFGRAVNVTSGGYVKVSGDITIHDGKFMRGLVAGNRGIVEASGDIKIYATDGVGIVAYGAGSNVKLTGDVVVSGDFEYSHQFAVMAGGVWATENAQVDITGSVTATGDGVFGLHVSADSTVNMYDGTLTTSGSDTTWDMGMINGGTINLDNVTVAEDNPNLLLCDGDSSAEGSLTATDSTLTGDILHEGTMAGTLDVTLADSTWSGAAEASGDIGTIDITLEGSDWNITGDTNTNGKVTADSDSNIDFRGADENIVVEIDNLAGAPGLNIKLDDVFTINNPDAKDSFQSSDPSVVEVVVDPVTGAVSIIPRSDGDAELTYSYIDETGKIQTVTIGVVSGAGSDPAGGGGGSSNCNSGVGAAMFALLGLAFVYKKK